MDKLSFEVDKLPEEPEEGSIEWTAPTPIYREPRQGDNCPLCGQGHLDYDGLLNLTCAQCGYAIGGCFT